MPGDAAALLWLRALQRLADRVAHEIKNPLNGAVLNLEVVRGRAGRPGVAGPALAPYVDAAATELARTAALAEALLALARPVAVPVDLGGALAPLVVLFRAVAEAHGGALVVEWVGDATAAGPLDGDAVRGGLAAALDAAVLNDASVRCTVEAQDGRATVRVQSSAGPVVFPERVGAVLRDAGVRLEEEADGVALVFEGGAAD